MGISDDIIKQIEAALGKGVSAGNMRQTAKEVTASIKLRTQTKGRGVKKTADSASKLEPLGKKYKVQRKRLRKTGKLAKETQPAKSNLTKTGKMFNDLTFKVRKDGFDIKFKTNESEEKAKRVEKGGIVGKKNKRVIPPRPFMNLAKFEIKLIVENIIDRIRRSN